MGVSCNALILTIIYVTAMHSLGNAQRSVRITTEGGIIGEGNIVLQCTFEVDPNDEYVKILIGFNVGTGEEITATLLSKKPPKLVLNNGSFDDGRMFIELKNENLLVWTMNIPKCDDEVKYFCKYEAFANTGSSTQPVSESDTTTVLLKAKPSNLSLIWVHPNMEPSKMNLSSSLEVRCTADVGRQDKGSLVWRVYGDSIVPTVLGDSDPRVTSTDYAASTACTTGKASTLNLKSLDLTYQNMVIACFVINDDFRREAPNVCTDTDQYCKKTAKIEIYYPVQSVTIAATKEGAIYMGENLSLICSADGNPRPIYTWQMEDDDRTLEVVMDGTNSRLHLNDLDIAVDSGVYVCTATNTIDSKETSLSQSRRVTIVEKPQTTTSVPPPTTKPPTTPNTSEPGGNALVRGDDDDTTIIIAVCVVAGVLLIVAIAICIFCILRKRKSKEIVEPSVKPYNNMSFQNPPQPDLVADEKKFNDPNLNNSFDMKNQDGLMYADITYDNRPRSRKPISIGDAASDYSDVQMPQV